MYVLSRFLSAKYIDYLRQPTPRFKENPSWLAVKPLHNTILIADPPSDPTTSQHPGQLEQPDLGGTLHPPEAAQPIITDEMEAMAIRGQQIHITALEIPSTYQAILSIVPALHARPPVLPIQDDNLPPPPQDGYDFMFHVGVVGRGPLRIEKLSHRIGYRMKDADDQYAPVIPPIHVPRDIPEPNPVEEMHRLMLESIASEQASTGTGLPPELPVDSPDHIQRGFGKPTYENCPDELNTEIDVTKLIHHLKESGIEV